MLRALSHEPNDVEWRAANHEQTAATQGPLEPETSNNKRKRQSQCFCAPQMFGGGIYLPDPSTYDPIEILLNTHDRSERDELVKIWRDNKLSELNFVGVVVRNALVYAAASLTSSSPRYWPASSPRQAAGLISSRRASHHPGTSAHHGTAASSSLCSQSSAPRTRRCVYTGCRLIAMDSPISTSSSAKAVAGRRQVAVRLATSRF
jgi:hypothetical protein